MFNVQIRHLALKPIIGNKEDKDTKLQDLPISKHLSKSHFETKNLESLTIPNSKTNSGNISVGKTKDADDLPHVFINVEKDRNKNLAKIQVENQAKDQIENKNQYENHSNEIKKEIDNNLQKKIFLSILQN